MLYMYTVHLDQIDISLPYSNSLQDTYHISLPIVCPPLIIFICLFLTL